MKKDVEQKRKLNEAMDIDIDMSDVTSKFKNCRICNEGLASDNSCNNCTLKQHLNDNNYFTFQET